MEVLPDDRPFRRPGRHVPAGQGGYPVEQGITRPADAVPQYRQERRQEYLALADANGVEEGRHRHGVARQARSPSNDERVPLVPLRREHGDARVTQHGRDGEVVQFVGN